MSYPDRLARKIVKKLNAVAEQKRDPGVWTTKFLKEQFCELGKTEDLFVFASGCDNACGGEWLYDLCWLDYGGRDEDGSNRPRRAKSARVPSDVPPCRAALGGSKVSLCEPSLCAPS